eukprot:1196703-Rhodomonas_salina.1
MSTRGMKRTWHGRAGEYVRRYAPRPYATSGERNGCYGDAAPDLRNAVFAGSATGRFSVNGLEAEDTGNAEGGRQPEGSREKEGRS